MPDSRPEMDDKPPVLGSWRNLYAVEIASLLTLIVLFWQLREHFS